MAYKHTSVMITSNLTFAEWPSVLGDAKMMTALIDRRLGVLPVIAVIEALQIDLGADVSALVAGVLEHRQALWSAAKRR